MDSPAESDLDLGTLAAVSTIVRTATAVRNNMERGILAGHSLSWSAFVVLIVLRSRGSQSSRDLAAEVGITGGTLTGVLDTLERRGLARRLTNPDDRRKVVVGLTTDGAHVVDETIPAFNGEEAPLAGDLTPHETAELVRLLRKASELG